MAKVLAACVILAVASLLLPSEPSYDPWAWLVWGRELASLQLDTTGGPSWKPLPVAFTTAFSLVGDDAAPALWLVVARASGLLALALAYRLGTRLGGPVAGVVAAAGLALTPDWLRYLAHGNEAPLAVALMLWAVERALERDERGALVVGALACLLRPEVFPLLLAYALVRRPRAAPFLAVVPLLWIVPEWIGSGNPLDAGAQATSEPSWSLSRAERPWLAALEQLHAGAGLPLELAALAAVAIAVRRRERARPGAAASSDRLVFALAAVALGWAAVYVAMTEAGFSGNPRYALPALVALCLLAGAGVGWTASTPRRATAVALAALAAAPWLAGRVEALRAEAVESAERARYHRDLERAVAAVSARAVDGWGRVTVNRTFQTHLAWELGVALRSTEVGRGRGLVFRLPDTELTGPLRLRRLRQPRVEVASAGAWRVLTPRLQGFHIRESARRNGGDRVVTR